MRVFAKHQNLGRGQNRRTAGGREGDALAGLETRDTDLEVGVTGLFRLGRDGPAYAMNQA